MFLYALIHYVEELNISYQEIQKVTLENVVALNSCDKELYDNSSCRGAALCNHLVIGNTIFTPMSPVSHIRH